MFYLIFVDLRWWKKRFWFHKCWENTIWGQHWRLQIYLWWLKLFSDQRMDYKYLSRKELCDVNLNLFENWDDNYIIEKDCTLFSWFCTVLLFSCLSHKNIVKPKSEVPKSKVPKSSSKGLRLTPKSHGWKNPESIKFNCQAQVQSPKSQRQDPKDKGLTQ